MWNDKLPYERTSLLNTFATSSPVGVREIIQQHCLEISHGFNLLRDQSWLVSFENRTHVNTICAHTHTHDWGIICSESSGLIQCLNLSYRVSCSIHFNQFLLNNRTVRYREDVTLGCEYGAVNLLTIEWNGICETTNFRNPSGSSTLMNALQGSQTAALFVKDTFNSTAAVNQSPQDIR